MIRDDVRGSVAIESALLLPIFLLATGIGFLVTIGGIAQGMLTYAVQQAALGAAQGAGWQAIFTANTAAAPMVSGATVTCAQSGSTWTCQAQANFQNPFGGLFNAPNVISLTAGATAVVPQQGSGGSS